MNERNQAFLKWINLLSDVFLIYISYIIAVYIRFELFSGVVSLHLASSKFRFFALIYSLAVTTVLFFAKLYQPRRMHMMGGVIFKILFINGLGTLMFITCLYLLRVMDFSRWTLFGFWLISSLAVICKHALVRLVLHYYRKRGYNLRYVAIAGSGRLAFQYKQDILNNPQFGYYIVGYFCKGGSTGISEGLGDYLGPYEDIASYLEHNDIDELVIALEPYEVSFMKYVLEAADKEGIKVTLIPFYNEIYPAHPTFEIIGNSKTINLRATPLDNIGWALVKRGMDIIGSLVAIILFSIPMVIVAIGVRLSSPGPVFFKQERVGLGKKPFRMLKFRSMRTDIDHNGWSTDEDERKTKFGSFIRKFSLDELPQLFNVLVGQMSLVGPRPELPLYVSQFKEEVPLYLVRQQVRPGMTGWAQVNGLRGNTSIEARVEYDIWYIENWSVGLDIRILFKTVFGGMMNTEKIKA